MPSFYAMVPSMSSAIVGSILAPPHDSGCNDATCGDARERPIPHLVRLRALQLDVSPHGYHVGEQITPLPHKVVSANGDLSGHRER